jgi:hypothetical protein
MLTQFNHLLTVVVYHRQVFFTLPHSSVFVVVGVCVCVCVVCSYILSHVADARRGAADGHARLQVVDEVSDEGDEDEEDQDDEEDDDVALHCGGCVGWSLAMLCGMEILEKG